MPIDSGLISMISVISTIVMGFLGSFGLYYKRERDKKDRIRAALISEIESMKGQIDSWSNTIGMVNNDDFNGAPVPESNPFITRIYDANTSEIGSLSPEEAEGVTQFYSSVIGCERKLKLLLETEEVGEPTVHVLLKEVVQLRNMMNAALLRLERGKSDGDPEQLSEELQWIDIDADSDIEQSDIDQLIQKWDLGEYTTISFSNDIELVKN